jgi:isopenicillin-N epimerase
MEFDWTATKDPTPMLVAPVGIERMREAGLEALRAHNHSIAWNGARVLCERWGTELAVPESMVGAMVTLPLPEDMGRSKPEADRLRAALLYEDRIEVQLHAWNDRLWVRICGQVYNDMDDIERLAAAVLARSGRVTAG